MHKHVAPNVIPRTVRPVDFERVDEQVHLLTMAGRFHRFSIVAGQVVFSRESPKTGEDLCLVRVNQFSLGQRLAGPYCPPHTTVRRLVLGSRTTTALSAALPARTASHYALVLVRPQAGLPWPQRWCISAPLLCYTSPIDFRAYPNKLTHWLGCRQPEPY